MAKKSTQIIGAIIAVIGFLLIVSDIFGYKLEFFPLKDGISTLGFIIAALGLVIATMFAKDDDDF